MALEYDICSLGLEYSQSMDITPGYKFENMLPSSGVSEDMELFLSEI